MEYTSEQLNYFRICYIAFNLVPEGLRRIFKQEWDFLYKTTLGEWKDTPKNGLDFYNNESRRSRSKNARCLATIQNGNTTEWDCSCLFFAILFSDSIGTSLGPAVNWDVDHLRQVRNDIAHISEAKLSDAEFMGYVGRVLLAFNSMNLPISDIDTVKNQTSFPTAEVDNLKDELKKAKSYVQVAQDTIQAKEEQVQTLTSDLQGAQDTMQREKEQVKCLTQEINSKVEPFCNLAFKPSHIIIRRSNDFTKIMTKMQELQDESQGAVSTIYLSGNPGCGKSQIARQIGQEIFTVRSCESEGLTFVATLNAETLETLVDSYISLAKQLGITEYTLTNLATSKVNSPKEIIQHLQRLILPKIKQSFYWLVIADNVVDLSMVRSYLPQTSSEEWGHGQVLITTQDSSSIPTSAPYTYHESLSAGMQPEDAVELLKQVSQISNHEQAKQVAEALEYQPLALAAAAFYVQTVVSNGSPNYSWTNYLEAFGRGDREATEEPLARENTAYSKTMTTAIGMAINRASESDEVLCQTFCFLSLCASESLPIEAAVNFVKVRTSGHTEELIKAKILKSSLITCLYSEDEQPEYLKLHNVVYQVLKKCSTFDSQFSKKRVQCLPHAISTFHSLNESESKRVFESRQVCVKLRKVTTHCKVLLHDILVDTSVKDLTHPDNVTVVSWLCSTAAVCCDLTNPSDANLFSKSACDFVHQISSTREGNLLKADVYTVRGRALSMQCQYQLSILRLEEATDIYTSIYGEEHGKVATNYNYLGDVYCTIGKYNQAKEYHEKALIVSKKIYGEEHADVARSYNHLGNVYRKLTQNSQAKEYHEKALIILENIYGEKHAHVARNYNYLGNDYLSLGNYNQAKEYDKKALYIRKNIYGEEHADDDADDATSYNNLGVDHYRLGQYDQAQEYHEKALYIRKKIYGEEHADVATSYNSLGNDHLGLRQYNQAQEYHKKALVIWKSIFGEEHADVASCYNSLGTDHCGLGQYNDALEYHEKALYIRRKIYGEEHARVAICYKNVGDDHWGLGQYGQAKEYHEKELIILKNIYGEEHAHVARNYNYLGYDYLNLGQYDQAKEYHEKALYIQKKIYGEKHADVGTSYNNLGVDHYRLGQYEQAQEYHEKALAIRKKNYGEEHADVAISCNNLGNDHLGLGQYDQALEYHEKALYIRRKIYGEEHARVATCYKNVGDDHYGLGQYNQAQEYYKKALAIQKKIYGEEHADVATSYKNLSIVDSNFRRRNQSRTNNCILL